MKKEFIMSEEEKRNKRMQKVKKGSDVPSTSEKRDSVENIEVMSPVSVESDLSDQPKNSSNDHNGIISCLVEGRSLQSQCSNTIIQEYLGDMPIASQKQEIGSNDQKGSAGDAQTAYQKMARAEFSVNDMRNEGKSGKSDRCLNPLEKGKLEELIEANEVLNHPMENEKVYQELDENPSLKDIVRMYGEDSSFCYMIHDYSCLSRLYYYSCRSCHTEVYQHV